MKVCGVLWVGVWAALLSSPAGAMAQTSTAVLDVALIFEKYEMTRDLETMFDEARRDAALEADKRRNDIDQMRRALSAFAPDSEDFTRREQDLMRAEVDFQVWSGYTENRLKADHKRWLLKIYHNAQATVKQIAEERKFDLVITYDRLTDDAPDSVTLRQQILLQKVIYHSERIDITEDVLKRLNETYRASGGINAPGTPPAAPTPTGNPDQPGAEAP